MLLDTVGPGGGRGDTKRMKLRHLGSKNCVKQNKTAKSHILQSIKANIFDNGKTK